MVDEDTEGVTYGLHVRGIEVLKEYKGGGWEGSARRAEKGRKEGGSAAQ